MNITVFFIEMRALPTMQHAHLSKRHAGSISLPFMCRSKKEGKKDCIAYSDASVIVIKSRKSKGYAIGDTNCMSEVSSLNLKGIKHLTIFLVAAAAFDLLMVINSLYFP